MSSKLYLIFDFIKDLKKVNKNVDKKVLIYRLFCSYYRGIIRWLYEVSIRQRVWIICLGFDYLYEFKALIRSGESKKNQMIIYREMANIWQDKNFLTNYLILYLSRYYDDDDFQCRSEKLITINKITKIVMYFYLKTHK